LKSIALAGCILALAACDGASVAGASMALQGAGIVGESLGWIDASSSSTTPRVNAVATPAYAFSPYVFISHPAAPIRGGDLIVTRPLSP